MSLLVALTTSRSPASPPLYSVRLMIVGATVEAFCWLIEIAAGALSVNEGRSLTARTVTTLRAEP